MVDIKARKLMGQCQKDKDKNTKLKKNFKSWCYRNGLIRCSCVPGIDVPFNSVQTLRPLRKQKRLAQRGQKVMSVL